MVKKMLCDLAIVFCIAALWASTSQPFMRYVGPHRTVRKWWGAFDWYYGNLSGMSNLDYIGRFKSPEDYSGERPLYDLPKKTVLYLQGDSHTAHPMLKDTDFAGVSEYHFIHREGTYFYHLDTAKRNVLIIEISESHFRDYFSDLRMLHEITDTTSAKKSISAVYEHTAPEVNYCSFIPKLTLDDIFNKQINRNLECNLFNYNFLRPMFGCKAAITYYLFKRASGDVVISDDGQFLFYKETVQLTGNGSSFSPIPQDEIRQLVENLNTIYDRYRADGFKEIYLSVLPNTVTVIQPSKYNQLIPIIQNDRNLKMKVIDVYSKLKENPAVYFLPGDTHWNNDGALLWLKTVNETLINNTPGA